MFGKVGVGFEQVVVVELTKLRFPTAHGTRLGRFGGSDLFVLSSDVEAMAHAHVESSLVCRLFRSSPIWMARHLTWYSSLVRR